MYFIIIVVFYFAYDDDNKTRYYHLHFCTVTKFLFLRYKYRRHFCFFGISTATLLPRRYCRDILTCTEDFERVENSSHQKPDIGIVRTRWKKSFYSSTQSTHSILYIIWCNCIQSPKTETRFSKYAFDNKEVGRLVDSTINIVLSRDYVTPHSSTCARRI